MTFADLQAGSRFKFTAAPRVKMLWLDFELVKGSATTCGPALNEQIWELNDVDMLGEVVLTPGHGHEHESRQTL